MYVTKKIASKVILDLMQLLPPQDLSKISVNQALLCSFYFFELYASRSAVYISFLLHKFSYRRKCFLKPPFLDVPILIELCVELPTNSESARAAFAGQQVYLELARGGAPTLTLPCETMFHYGIGKGRFIFNQHMVLCTRSFVVDYVPQLQCTAACLRSGYSSKFNQADILGFLFNQYVKVLKSNLTRLIPA